MKTPRKPKCVHCMIWDFDKQLGIYTQRCAHCFWTTVRVPSLDLSGDRLRALQSQEAHAELCPRITGVSPLRSA